MLNNNITQVIVEEEKKNRGILLIATGHHIYMQMAYNLCLSIKASDPSASVTLLHDDSLRFLTEIQRFSFNGFVKVDNGNAFGLKLSIYELSPYQETIYLDADMLWICATPISTLFNSFKEVDFTIANRGINKLSEGGDNPNDWINKHKALEVMGDVNWVNCSSEFIYFKKTDKVRQLFTTAKEFYANNEMVNRKIGNQYPDEPALSYAMQKHGIMPHLMPFYPSFWEPHYKEYYKNDAITSKFYLLSMGGKSVSGRIQQLYNNMAKYYANKHGVKAFLHVNKSRVLKERTAI